MDELDYLFQLFINSDKVFIEGVDDDPQVFPWKVTFLWWDQLERLDFRFHYWNIVLRYFYFELFGIDRFDFFLNNFYFWSNFLERSLKLIFPNKLVNFFSFNDHFIDNLQKTIIIFHHLCIAIFHRLNLSFQFLKLILIVQL